MQSAIIFLLSLTGLASALSPVPLLAYSSTSFPALESLRTNEQATALKTVFGEDDICNFDAIIVATQEALHATHLLSTHSTLLDSYRTAPSRVHLPYLSYSSSPIEQAKDVAARCSSEFVFVSHQANVPSMDLSRKYVVYLDFPSRDDINPMTVSRQLDAFTSIFPSHLLLFTGVPSSKRASSSESVPEPTGPLPATSYRLLTPTLIFSLGLVFGLVIPLIYISIAALGSIKSPVGTKSYKGPSAEKKNQ